MFKDFYQDRIDDEIYPYGRPNARGLGNKVASGRLYNSLSVKVIDDAEGLKLEISYMDYLKNVNFGRRPRKKKVPISALLQWMTSKGVRGKNKKGKFIKDLSFAFAIQQNIFKFGIRPANIFDKAYDSLEDILANPPAYFRDEYERLYDAIGQDVENFLINTINKEIPSK